ncbi:MAG: VWA domain-containing protein [Acidobacteriota bacterium]|nr:MAG: VWA domain-containing protein [Acidobacteriota bacterium]
MIEFNFGGGMSLEKLRGSFRPAVMMMIAVLLVTVAGSNGWGQATRERRVNKSEQGKTEKPESKSTEQKPAAPEKKPVEEQGKPAGKAPDEDLDAEPIRINSTLVAVPVSVTDVSGQTVLNLRAEDFFLEEEGVQQQVQTLGQPGKTPLELALLFDVSRSVRNRFDFERQAAGRFLQQLLKPGDYVSVFAIGREPKVAVQRSDNAEQVIRETLTIEPTEESTAFFDTVVAAARYLDDHANPGVRRVMVIISDGEDTNSERHKLTDALREIQRSDALFYSINPSGPSIWLNKISLRGHEGMTKLANETGGLSFLPDKLDDLTQVFSQIANELQAQYLLGYYSTNETNDGKFRRISVRIPRQPDLRIRARNGYYAPKN